MATNPLEILNAAKKQQLSENTGIDIKKINTITKSDYSIESLDDLQEMYFGNGDNEINLNEELMPNGERREIYDANRELSEIREGIDYNKVNTKIPSKILESIVNNPLDMPTGGLKIESDIVDSELRDKTLDIINKLEKRDGKQSVSDGNKEKKNYASDINLNDIINEIENIIDDKLKKYSRNIINNIGKESNMRVMSLGDVFTFIDDDNNVYECKMVYKGKGKIKKK